MTHVFCNWWEHNVLEGGGANGKDPLPSNEFMISKGSDEHDWSPIHDKRHRSFT